MTQLATLRAHFTKPGIKLTQDEATASMGISRLSPRIGELERSGWQFLHRMIPAPSRHGTARVSEYVLIARAGGGV